MDWYLFIREVYKDHLINFSKELKGPNQIAEIDKSKFGEVNLYSSHTGCTIIVECQ